MSDLADADVLEIQLLENSQRSDVTPLEEATAIRQCIQSERYGSGKAAVEALAQKLGKSARWVYERLALLTRLSTEARHELEHGNIEPGHANVLVRLSEAAQAECLTYMLYRRMWVSAEGAYAYRRGERLPECRASVRDLLEFVAAEIRMDLSRAPFDLEATGLLPEVPACTACPFRMVEGDRSFCTDKACHGRKTAAAVELRVRAAKDAHPEAIEVSTSYSMPKGDAVPQTDYRVAKEGDVGAVPAVVVDGHHSDLGKLQWVVPTNTPEQRQLAKEAKQIQEAEDKRKKKVARDFRARLAEAIVACAPAECPIEVLRGVASQAYQGLWGETAKQVCRALGRDRLDHDAISQMNSVEVTRLLSLLTVARELADDYGDPKASTKLASMYGVDVELVRREVEEKHKPKPVRTSAPKAGAR